MCSTSKGELRDFYAIQDIIPKMMMTTVMTMMITTVMISANTVPQMEHSGIVKHLKSYRRLIQGPCLLGLPWSKKYLEFSQGRTVWSAQLTYVRDGHFHS